MNIFNKFYILSVTNLVYGHHYNGVILSISIIVAVLWSCTNKQEKVSANRQRIQYASYQPELFIITHGNAGYNTPRKVMQTRDSRGSGFLVYGSNSHPLSSLLFIYTKTENVPYYASRHHCLIIIIISHNKRLILILFNIVMSSLLILVYAKIIRTYFICFLNSLNLIYLIWQEIFRSDHLECAKHRI
jgi:hypothetical protein